MDIKQIFLTLTVLFTVNAFGISQVKKQYRDETHKSTTVVIKEEGANDLEILNSQFNLDDYAVNEQIKITTAPSSPTAKQLPDNVSGGKPIMPPAPDLSSATASANQTYERPKTKMKRWSVREKTEVKATEETPAAVPEETLPAAVPAVAPTKISNKRSTATAKKASSGKYRKKSKKVKKKRRGKRLKNRKRKIRRSRKVTCYKF